MWKRIALFSIVLWAITVGAFAYLFVVGTGTKVDQRVEISLNPAERDLILGEMRLLLEGVRGIIGAVADDDNEAAAKAAGSIGMQMAADVNPTLMAKLPLEFKETGMGVHRRFDELALKAHSLPGREILRETHAIMGTCIGCHVTYKITERN